MAHGADLSQMIRHVYDQRRSISGPLSYQSHTNVEIDVFGEQSCKLCKSFEGVDSYQSRSFKFFGMKPEADR